MLGSMLMVAGASMAGVAAIAIVVLLGVRARQPVAVDLLRRFSRLFNPLQMRTAGSRGATTSVVRHVGRTSGRAYATPVDAVATDDGFLIALPYESRSNWVRNVLASGTATIVDDGCAHRVDRPELIPLQTVATLFPPADQRSLRMLRVEHCLRLRRVDAADVTDAIAAVDAA
ncbi:MAG: PNPOx family protein [Candidatus Limnocylindrales bacterium]